VFCIFIFGEIMPTAFFTGPGQLLMAGRCHNIVKWMMWLLYPVTYPISSFLDYIFAHGEHDSTVSRAELGALIALQAADHVSVLDAAAAEAAGSAASSSSGAMGPVQSYGYGSMGEKTPLKTPARAPQLSPVTGSLKQSEVGIMTRILQLAGTTLQDALIPTSKVYSLCCSTRLDKRALAAIAHTGYSRIPVYFEHNRRFVGYILAKSLLDVDPAQALPVSSLPLRQPLVVSPDTSLLSVLDLFKAGRCHIAFVSRSPDAVVRYIQARLQVEQYLDQQSHGIAATAATTAAASATRLRDGCVFSPANINVNAGSSSGDVEVNNAGADGAPSAADVALARELGLAVGGSAQDVALALAEAETQGVITLQDVLQRVFRGHDLHESVMQSGSKYSRAQTPVRGQHSAVHNLSYSAASPNTSAYNSASSSAHKSGDSYQFATGGGDAFNREDNDGQSTGHMRFADDDACLDSLLAK
jgi:hypothetical protein